MDSYQDTGRELNQPLKNGGSNVEETFQVVCYSQGIRNDAKVQ